MIFLRKNWPFSFKVISFKKTVFVNNKRTVIARNFFLENIGIWILFRRPPTSFRYIEPFSRNYDFRKGKKNFNLKYLWNSWANHFAQRTRPINIKNLPLQTIWKRLSEFYSRNRWTYKTNFSFFNFLLKK